MYRLYITVVCSFIISCSTKDTLKEGTFLLYEEGQVVDTIYRYGDYQIEAAHGKSLIVKLNWITNDSLTMSGIESSPKDIDSLIFIVWHKEQSKNKYNLFGQPLNSNLEYSYKAVIEKISDHIQNPEYLKQLEELNSF